MEWLEVELRVIAAIVTDPEMAGVLAEAGTRLSDFSPGPTRQVYALARLSHLGGYPTDYLSLLDMLHPDNRAQAKLTMDEALVRYRDQTPDQVAMAIYRLTGGTLLSS